MKTNCLVVICITFFLVFHRHTYSQFAQVYDLRTQGLVTPVKDQQTCGACWAFAGIASIESNWKKTGFGTFMLSEDNIIDCHMFDEAPCVGGSFYMLNALLSRHGGPLLGTADPYTPSVTNCPNNQPFPPTPAAYNEEIRFLSRDKNTIKQAIIDHGAIATSMFFNMTNYNATKFKYFDNIISSVDSAYPHCVTLAGWNDTMVFAGAPASGGWIIKDSYGTSWAQSGYFYVSYYDAGILSETAYFPNRADVPITQNKSNAYYYDTFGWVDNYGFGNNVAHAVVKYTIQPFGGIFTAQQIKKIGTYITADSTNLNITLYKNFAGNVLSNMISSKSMFCKYKGFYTIPFTLPSDSIGTPIYIKVTYQLPLGKTTPIPVEKYESGHTSGFSATSGNCWISPNGTSWISVGFGTAYNFDVCVKMYTEDAPKAKFTAQYDSICMMQNAVYNDNSPMPKDSIRWLVNEVNAGNMPSLNYFFSSLGISTVKLVAYYGYNTDTSAKTITILPQPLIPVITQSHDTLFSSSAFSYQWYDNAGIIPGAILQYYKPLQNGVYAVQVFDQNNCFNISLPYQYTIGWVDNTKDIGVRIFPNPTNGFMQFEFSDYLPDALHIYNAYGNLVYAYGNHNSFISIDLSVLSDGLYLFQFIFSNHIIERKIIKK